MLDYMAWLILGLAWLFGGAALIDDTSQSYTLALKQWSVVTVFIVVVVLAVGLVFWAFQRLVGSTL